METTGNTVHHEPWNKGKIVGQKAPFKLKDIWALRVRLQMEGRVRELALFNLGIDSPDGHPKLLHLWPVKLLQAGRSDGDYTGVMAMREAASFKR